MKPRVKYRLGDTGLAMDGTDEKQKLTYSRASVNSGGTDAWVRYVMKFPISWARHLSIPAPQWNARRHVLAAMCPVFGAPITIIGCGDDWGAMTTKGGPLPGVAWAARFGALGLACVLVLAKPAKLHRWHSLLLVQVFGFTVAWCDIPANEFVALFETPGAWRIS